MPEIPKSETGGDNQKSGSKSGKDNQIPASGTGGDTPQSSDSDTGEDVPDIDAAVAALKKTNCELQATSRRIPIFAVIGGFLGGVIVVLVMWLLQCGCFAATKA